MDKKQKKQIRRYIAWGCAVAVVVLLAVLPLLAAPKGEEDGPQASILSAQAEHRDITRKLLGGGILTSAEHFTLTIPKEVKLVEYLVGNGDVVLAGDPIAVVDRVSVMTAITQVQETLDYLAKEIQSVSGDTVSENVTAKTGGTVKHIYAQVGDDVQDVMLEHGALAVLSLDGLMAVKLECATDLVSGDKVCVKLSDGSEEEGRVQSNLEGVLVVTVEDDNYQSGDTVEVTTQDGSSIGTGELYIYSPWTAHGYTGTVHAVRVKEGQKIYSGQTLFSLKETGETSDYQKLINQRREYEEMMAELFQMYGSETIDAPCDGIVTGVDKNGAYMLSDSGEWSVSLLTHTPAVEASGFLGYAARVMAVREDGLELLADPTLRSLEETQVDGSAMTEPWSYSGGTQVYTRSESGILTPEGFAREGDLLLFLGDAEAIHWIIRLSDSGVRTTTALDSFQVTLLADTGTPEDGGTPDSGDGENDDDQSDIPPAEEKKCDGSENCEAPVHEPGCPHYKEPTTYWGYVARIEEIGEDGTVKVKQTAGTYAIEDPANPPAPSDKGLTVDKAYTGLPGNVGDLVWIIIDGTGAFYNPSITVAGQAGGWPGGLGGLSGLGGLGGFSGFGGMGGGAAAPAFEPYSLDTLTVATVTSQETMLLDITVDEGDILLLQEGQKAQLTVGALGGQTFEATITEIALDGSNAGGRTKFTVTAATPKHENMYPGMTGSLAVEIETVENALVLPVAALTEQGAKTFVYTGYDAEKEVLTGPVEVTTGISDGEYVEIIGLEPGTKVYYAYYDTLEHSLTPENGFF